MTRNGKRPMDIRNISGRKQANHNPTLSNGTWTLCSKPGINELERKQ
jgi:hypothetical protein